MHLKQRSQRKMHQDKNLKKASLEDCDWETWAEQNWGWGMGGVKGQTRRE